MEQRYPTGAHLSASISQSPRSLHRRRPANTHKSHCRQQAACLSVCVDVVACCFLLCKVGAEPPASAIALLSRPPSDDFFLSSPTPTLHDKEQTQPDIHQFAKPPATAVFSQHRRCAGMTPNLKPLLLPQLVEQRFERRAELQQGNGLPALTTPDHGDLSYVYYTTNSSASDITSPVTPIFSPKGHQRFSSSTSSLELPMQPPPECPASPSQTSSTMSSLRQLPDVEEEPFGRGEDTATLSDHFGLYSCLCTYCSFGGFVGHVRHVSCILLTLVFSQVINLVPIARARKQSSLANLFQNLTLITIWAFSAIQTSPRTLATLGRNAALLSLLSPS